MSKIQSAIREMCMMERQARGKGVINGLHPLVKLVVTIAYIAVVVSFDKYNLAGLLGMVIYPLALFCIGEVGIKTCMKRICFVLPLVMVVGVWNPVFDRSYYAAVGGIVITGGMVSMLTLMIKGIFAVTAAYLLMITTSIDELCFAMRKIHIPEILITVLMLTYRYINVLLKEADRMMQAYALRAPGQKGVHIRVWGSLAGMLLLRSMDRASGLYDSMKLRGYELSGAGFSGRNAKHIAIADVIWLLLWLCMFAANRLYPLFLLVGNIIV